MVLMSPLVAEINFLPKQEKKKIAPSSSATIFLYVHSGLPRADGLVQIHFGEGKTNPETWCISSQAQKVMFKLLIFIPLLPILLSTALKPICLPCHFSATHKPHLFLLLVSVISKVTHP